MCRLCGPVTLCGIFWGLSLKKMISISIRLSDLRDKKKKSAWLRLSKHDARSGHWGESVRFFKSCLDPIEASS